MAFSFRLTFTGLCAFVPRLLNTGERNQGTILLVNATTPVEDLNLHTHLVNHDPKIEIHGKKIDVTGFDFRFEFIRNSGTPGTTAPDELLPIDALPTPKPPFPAPDTDDDHDSYWIMDMAAIDAGNVANDCFGAQPTQVTARFKLTAGFLSTSRMVEDQNDGSDILWNFQKSETATPKITRPIAAEIAVTCIADADQVVLIRKRFGSTAEERIALLPVAGEVVLAVENLCDSTPTVGPSEGQNPTLLGEISDFGWFYRLVANQPPLLYLPYPVPGSGLTDTMCPPARFPQHPSA